LAAKQLYADNNGGIGVDGTPYEPPLTKAQKKAKAKAEKDGAGKTPPSASSVVSSIEEIAVLSKYF
jgi:hypothetical protein